MRVWRGDVNVTSADPSWGSAGAEGRISRDLLSTRRRFKVDLLASPITISTDGE